MKDNILRRGSKTILIVVLAVACIVAVIMVWIGGRLSPYDVKFDNENVVHYNYGWTYNLAEQYVELYSLPSKIVTDDGSITLHNILPEIMPNGASISIATNDQNIIVTVGGENIYEYGQKLNTIFSKSYGSVQHCIRIPKNSAKKDIEITISNSCDEREVLIQDMLLGSKTSIMFELVRRNIPNVIACIVFFIFGIILLVWALIAWTSGMRYKIDGFIYMGLFCVISAIWVATNTNFLQFFSSNEVSAYLISYFSFMLLPILFLLYMDSICMNCSRVIELLCVLFVLNFSASIFLCAFGIADLTNMFLLTNILIVCSIFVCLWICIREIFVYKRNDIYEVIIAILVFIVFTLASVVLRYISTIFSNSQFYICGVFIFAALLVTNMIKKAVVILREGMETKFYRRLAYVDMMTSLSNRAAFDNDMKQPSDNIKMGTRRTLILCDINNLKETNDLMGHSTGDLLIKKFGNCLKNVFDDKGKCYRIGGDEFTVVMDNVSDDVVSTYMRNLFNVVEMKNSVDKENTKISYAWGIAHATADKGGNIDAKILFDKADRDMYDHKQRMRRDENNE